jgi:hypothetical protein
LSVKVSATKCKLISVTSTPQKIILKNTQLKDFKVDEEHAYFLVEE